MSVRSPAFKTYRVGEAPAEPLTSQCREAREVRRGGFGAKCAEHWCSKALIP